MILQTVVGLNHISSPTTLQIPFWFRYDSYEMKEIEEKHYITPKENSKVVMYDPFDVADDILVDILTIGRCVEKNDIEETGSSSGYSFPGFGTGNYYKENDVNINNEDNIVNISGRGDVSPSTNQSNISGNSSRDFGTQDSSNNLSSGNNIDNPTSNNGGNIKTNNGSKSNDSIDNKTNSNINSNSAVKSSRSNGNSFLRISLLLVNV